MEPYATDGVVRLVPYDRERDAQACYAAWQDEDTRRAFNGAMDVHFDAFAARWGGRNRFIATIERVDTGAPVGCLFLSPPGGLPDLAILLYRPFRGLGYGTRAFALAASYCLRVFGLSRLYAGCYAHNTASLRMLAKCGFVRHPQGDVPEKDYLTGEEIVQMDFVLEGAGKG